MKKIAAAILALTFLSTSALAYETVRKQRHRMPGDEGYNNQWWKPKAKRVGAAGTAFGFIPITPAPGGRPVSLEETPHKMKDK